MLNLYCFSECEAERTFYYEDDVGYQHAHRYQNDGYPQPPDPLVTIFVRLLDEGRQIRF